MLTRLVKALRLMRDPVLALSWRAAWAKTGGRL